MQSLVLDRNKALAYMIDLLGNIYHQRNVIDMWEETMQDVDNMYKEIANSDWKKVEFVPDSVSTDRPAEFYVREYKEK